MTLISELSSKHYCMKRQNRVQLFVGFDVFILLKNFKNFRKLITSVFEVSLSITIS